jgi:hypothetical protein
MNDMALGAAGARLRPGHSGRVSSRRRSRVPSHPTAEGRARSKVSREQVLDGSEFLVDTSITLVPAPDYQENPAVAFDGANFLVVWEDCRNGNDYDIYGARVTPSGTLLDPAGFVISQSTDDQGSAAIGFDGTNFLVVWEDSRGGWYPDIYGARVTPQGTVLDFAGFVISQAEDIQESPALEFDGTNFLVVWDDYRGGSDFDIYGARVTPQGVLLDTAGVVISQAADYQVSPALDFDGANFLVVWEDWRNNPSYPDIYGARVTPVGTVLDPSGIIMSTATNGHWSPAVAFDGANSLVVWEDGRGAGGDDIYGTRVTPAGVVLDPSGIAISTAANNQWSPAVAFDSANFLVAWEDYRSGNDLDIYGARVTPAGSVLDPSGLVISQSADVKEFPALGFGGAKFLAVWQDWSSNMGEPDIYGARVTKQGTVLDSAGLSISLAASFQEYPALGFDGTNFLVVWADYRNHPDYSDIYGARVTPAGVVLDPSGIAIATAANYKGDAVVAFDGASFLVVWEDYRNGNDFDVYGARVTSGGTVLDPSGFIVSQEPYDQWAPALGFDGANFLVVWEDGRSGGYADIYGARVTPAGTVLDPAGFVVSQTADDQEYPALGFDGANFLVAWEDYRNGNGYDIYGARVTPAGTVLDPSGIAISQAADYQENPALDFDGASFLVVWDDSRNGNDYDIYGARVTPAGMVLDPSGLVVSQAAEQGAPAVAFDGANFLVAWEDFRNGNDYDIYGARVTPAGSVSDSGPIIGQGRDQMAPALARGSGSQLLLVYQGWAVTVGGKAYNTSRVWGELDPNPGIVETPGVEVRTTKCLPTIVRGVLMMGQQLTASGSRPELLDAAGRKVAVLHAGANDVSRLAPGVYFEREAASGGRSAVSGSAVRKVVIQH